LAGKLGSAGSSGAAIRIGGVNARAMALAIPLAIHSPKNPDASTVVSR
jgi:hypothetical protein